MQHALFLSPHLDDVAFSAAGTLLGHLQSGWICTLVTVFTASVPVPQGFALRCQTDKGLPPEADYMALRRAEDRAFCDIIGLAHPVYWAWTEAPHRGYDSPAALFAGERAGDDVWRSIAAKLRELPEPDAVFAPQGLGNHVDHLQLIRAVLERGWASKTQWYCDTPYAIRQPDAPPSELLPRGLKARAIALSPQNLERKIAGCCAYASQIGFQFGGAAQVERQLTEFHAAQARKFGWEGFAETHLAP